MIRQEGYSGSKRAGPPGKPAGLRVSVSCGRARRGPEVSYGDDDTVLVLLPADLLDRLAVSEGGLLTTATQRSPRVLQTLPSLERAGLCARVAADNKARDVIVLDMRGLTPLYDFFVLATGNSRRQVHTITEEIDAAMRDQGDVRLSVEGYEASKWVVQDYGDVVVHVFDPATREYYAVEDLWADAPRVDWERV